MTALTWRRASPYHLASECGRYTVAKYHGPDAKYALWDVSEARGPRLVDFFASPDDAKAAAKAREARERA
jgi:hypothetical protein